jgi:hypothetical protein
MKFERSANNFQFPQRRLISNQQGINHGDTECTEKNNSICHCKFVICHLAISEMTNFKLQITIDQFLLGALRVSVVN